MVLDTIDGLAMQSHTAGECEEEKVTTAMKTPLELIHTWRTRAVRTRDPAETRALVGRALGRLDELKGEPADLARFRQQLRVSRSKLRGLEDAHRVMLEVLGDLNEARDELGHLQAKYDLALRLLREARR